MTLRLLMPDGLASNKSVIVDLLGFAHAIILGFLQIGPKMRQ